MAHPYDPKAQTGQELAKSRYGGLPKRNPNEDIQDEGDKSTSAPARQVSNTGKVKTS